jgi:hypothetical protein
MPKQEPTDASLLLEVWKATVEVQKHFNDIGLRIRSLALTALTFILGGTAFAFLNGDLLRVPVLQVLSPAVFLPIIGVPLWVAFWIIDVRWYHRLLRGAVAEGKEIEEMLSVNGVPVSLAKKIEDASRFPRGTGWPAQKASRRLNTFYACGCVALALASLFVLAAGWLAGQEIATTALEIAIGLA